MAAVSRKRVSGPTVYHRTHSHSCERERERSVRVRNETGRDETGRDGTRWERGDAVRHSDQAHSQAYTRPSPSATRYTYQCSVSCPVDVILELRVIESLSVPMAISDLETNDRSTNNGYAFFRDVPKWSRSNVPH